MMMGPMKLLLFSLFICFNTAHASVAEIFGASASTMAVGNQASFDEDASLLMYAPSLLVNAAPQYNLGLINSVSNTKDIKDVVVTSPMNSNVIPPYQRGTVEQNRKVLTLAHLNALFPFMGKSKLGLNIYVPMTKLMEISTGDHYLPEYVFYRARNNRLLAHGSLIFPLSNSISASLGLHSGVQSQGQTEMIGRNSGSTEPSSGKLVLNATPSIGVTFSVAHQTENSKTYFAFQDTVKSEFKNDAFGFTPLDTTTTSFPFSLQMSSLLYFDPRIYRVGHMRKFDDLKIMASIEYQDWSEYQTPKLKLENTGGIIISSFDYESIKTSNPLIPHLGVSFKNYHAGISFRPQVIKSDLNNNGTSVDSDLYNFSLGHHFSFSFLDKNIKFHTSYLLQLLKSYEVEKTPNREDGQTGEKLGSPGYSVGGQIHVLSFGISWVI